MVASQSVDLSILMAAMTSQIAQISFQLQAQEARITPRLEAQESRILQFSSQLKEIQNKIEENYKETKHKIEAELYAELKRTVHELQLYRPLVTSTSSLKVEENEKPTLSSTGMDLSILMAAMTSQMAQISSQLQAQEARITSWIQAQEARSIFQLPLNSSAMDAKITQLLDNLVRGSAQLNIRQDKIEEKDKKNIEERQDNIEEKHDEKRDQIEGKQDNIEEPDKEKIEAKQDKVKEIDKEKIEHRQDNIKEKDKEKIEKNQDSIEKNDKEKKDKFEERQDNIEEADKDKFKEIYNISSGANDKYGKDEIEEKHKVKEKEDKREENQNGIEQRENKTKTELDELKDLIRQLQLNRSITSANSPKVETPTFDGTTSFGVFKLRFEKTAKVNNWSVEDKVDMLTLSLKGSAAEFLLTIPDVDINSYDAIIGAFQIRHENEHKILVDKLNSEIRNRREDKERFEKDLYGPWCP
ncbi:PREDICTED: DNA ligase 1-like [Rhagoletis zephyria]|uniref:DNA ligase 1-like n=1 Tax=Rhagoletis zephyria TaxID=28612 RepID=UPI00081126E2|nr:PREDICTED: DNA ligase 1-like [Rhagoletis zephyria]